MQAEPHHLHDEIAKVAPITGLSFPDGFKNHKTAVIRFTDEATPNQQHLARKVLEAFDHDKKYDPDEAAFLDGLAQLPDLLDAEFHSIYRAVKILNLDARKKYLGQLGLSAKNKADVLKLAAEHCITLPL